MQTTVSALPQEEGNRMYSARVQTKRNAEVNKNRQQNLNKKVFKSILKKEINQLKGLPVKKIILLQIQLMCNSNHFNNN